MNVEARHSGVSGDESDSVRGLVDDVRQEMLKLIRDNTKTNKELSNKVRELTAATEETTHRLDKVIVENEKITEKLDEVMAENDALKSHQHECDTMIELMKKDNEEMKKTKSNVVTRNDRLESIMFGSDLKADIDDQRPSTKNLLEENPSEVGEFSSQTSDKQFEEVQLQIEHLTSRMDGLTAEHEQVASHLQKIELRCDQKINNSLYGKGMLVVIYG